MENVLNSIINNSMIGFITAWLGMLGGILFSFFVKQRGRRFKGTILGFIGGLMLSIVCFDLLPESFEAGSIYIGIIGITFELILAVTLDGSLEHDKITISNHNKYRFLKAAIFMSNSNLNIRSLWNSYYVGSCIW